jgi:hypothetical protein
MASSEPRPDTINALRYGADASFAMLAGMQLDVFTPLSSGPLTAAQIANAIGIGPERLRLLLYALVAAGLLTEEDGHFSNASVAQTFLVQDAPSYVGDLHEQLSSQWSNKLNTAESLRTGLPQARLNFAQAPQEELEVFLCGMHARGTGDAAYILAEHYDFSSATTLVDVGGGRRAGHCLDEGVSPSPGHSGRPAADNPDYPKAKEILSCQEHSTAKSHWLPEPLPVSVEPLP